MSVLEQTDRQKKSLFRSASSAAGLCRRAQTQPAFECAPGRLDTLKLLVAQRQIGRGSDCHHCDTPSCLPWGIPEAGHVSNMPFLELP